MYFRRQNDEVQMAADITRSLTRNTFCSAAEW